MKDRFSAQAKQYAFFRPQYPQELYAFIFRHVKAFDLAWDAGTGNGQAAAVIATSFNRVLATDISKNQLDNATRLDNVDYVEAGETTNLLAKSVDLITIAQAIHWFDRERFYNEVKRVAKPGAIIALWGYGLLSVGSEIDHLIHEFYAKVVGPYWDSERKLIDEAYHTLAFPFREIPNSGFQFNAVWSIDHLDGYLSTWSSVQRYIRENGHSPVPEWVEKIRAHWCPSRMHVTFEVFARVGIVE